MLCKDCKNFKRIVKIRQLYVKRDAVRCGISKHALIDHLVLKKCEHYKKDNLYKLKLWRKIKMTKN